MFLELSVETQIPLWSLILALVSIVAVFVQVQMKVSKNTENIKGVEKKLNGELTQAVKKLVESNIKLESAMIHMKEDIDEIKNRD